MDLGVLFELHSQYRAMPKMRFGETMRLIQLASSLPSLSLSSLVVFLGGKFKAICVSTLTSTEGLCIPVVAYNRSAFPLLFR